MSTDTPTPAETAEQTDARRADAIWEAIYLDVDTKTVKLGELAAAIRVSDEAAGMVLVPADEIARLRDVAKAARQFAETGYGFTSVRQALSALDALSAKPAEGGSHG